MDPRTNRRNMGSIEAQVSVPACAMRFNSRHILFALSVSLIYYLLNLPEVIVISNLGMTVWYPAVGLVLAVLLGVSPWYFFVLMAADMLTTALIYHQPLVSWSVLFSPPVSAGSYALAAYFLRTSLHIDLKLSRRLDILRYLIATLIGALGATFGGVVSLAADKSIPWSQFWPTILTWYAGDAISLLSFAPFLLIFVLPSVRRWLSAPDHDSELAEVVRPDSTPPVTMADLFEAVGQASSIVLVLWIMFGPKWSEGQYFYLAFIPIVWIAMRHGIKRVVVGLLGMHFGIVFALGTIARGPVKPVKIEVLMLVVSATGLVIGAAVTERKRIANDLEDHTRFLNSLIENSPMGIVIHDLEGRVQLYNDAFSQLFLLGQEDITGQLLDSLISSPDQELEVKDVTSQLVSGKPVHTTARKTRRDGTILDLEINAVAIVRDGQTNGAYVIYRDISEQVRATAVGKEHAEALNVWVNELQLRTLQMTLLNDMAGLLQCAASTEEAFGVVAQAARNLFVVSTSGGLFIFKSSRNLLEISTTWGKGYASEQMFAPDGCWALRRGQAHWSEFPGGSAVCPHLRNAIPASYLCVPMVAQGETVGVLHIQYDRSASNKGIEAFETLQDSQQRLAIAVAGQVALSLASLRLRETLRDQSIRDPLTGLFNRRFMQESLDRELQRARRKNRPLAIIFLDLDHFKRFNDVFGHDAGDVVLKAMAELFGNHFRGEDVICRYGGEEFAMILPESSASDAASRADELRQAAKALKVQYKGMTLEPVTLSIGIAAFPEHAPNGEELLQIADKCLYVSKAKGRDRITVAVRSANSLADTSP